MNAQAQKMLKPLNLTQLKKLATIVFYDTTLDDLDDETEDSLVDAMSSDDQVFEDNGIIKIWTREGKVGDDVPLSDLIAQL